MAFLHRRLRSGLNDARPEGRATNASHRTIISSGRHPFLSGRFGRACRPVLAGLSAAARGVNSDDYKSALSSPSDGASPHPSASPRAGHDPLEDRDRAGKIHSPRKTVNRFSGTRYEIAKKAFACGKKYAGEERC